MDKFYSTTGRAVLPIGPARCYNGSQYGNKFPLVPPWVPWVQVMNQMSEFPQRVESTMRVPVVSQAVEGSSERVYKKDSRSSQCWGVPIDCELCGCISKRINTCTNPNPRLIIHATRPGTCQYIPSKGHRYANSVSNICDLYLTGAAFESWPGHQIV
jgi:hypothetical protein